jgi:hypothetical protein
MSSIREILDTMDVPELRKKDFRWLKRNLAIRNKNHPKFKEVMELIKEKL